MLCQKCSAESAAIIHSSPQSLLLGYLTEQAQIHTPMPLLQLFSNTFISCTLRLHNLSRKLTISKDRKKTGKKEEEYSKVKKQYNFKDLGAQYMITVIIYNLDSSIQIQIEQNRKGPASNCPFVHPGQSCKAGQVRPGDGGCSWSPTVPFVSSSLFEPPNLPVPTCLITKHILIYPGKRFRISLQFVAWRKAVLLCLPAPTKCPGVENTSKEEAEPAQR